MDKLESDQPIRIVKKKGGHAGHHGGAWKVAYADFVTAMMALFIVLWIVGQSKAVKESVSAYFKDPGVFTSTKGSGALIEGKTGVSAAPTVEEVLKKQEEQLKEMGEKIKENLTKTDAVKQLASQVKIEIVKEGLRIELLDETNSFFDVGTSNLKEEARGILTVIAGEIGKLPNEIIVEGHTDSRPYSSADGYTNYELSADRANAARRVLVKNGLEQAKIAEVAAYADRHLRNTADPLDATNRRVSIIIKYLQK